MIITTDGQTDHITHVCRVKASLKISLWIFSCCPYCSLITMRYPGILAVGSSSPAGRRILEAAFFSGEIQHNGNTVLVDRGSTQERYSDIWMLFTVTVTSLLEDFNSKVLAGANVSTFTLVVVRGLIGTRVQPDGSECMAIAAIIISWRALTKRAPSANHPSYRSIHASTLNA